MQDNIPDADKTAEQLLGEVRQLREKLAITEKVVKPVSYDTLDYFNRRVQEEVYRSTRYKYVFSVVLVEMDNFKLFSGRAGEAAADEVLDMLVTVVRDSTRNTDLRCHVEASKLAIILPYTDVDGANIATERLRQAVERVFALQGLSRNIQISVSIGIAGYPVNAVTAEQLIKTRHRS